MRGLILHQVQFFPLSSLPLSMKSDIIITESSDSKAWIDYVILARARSESIFSGNTLQLSDSRSVYSGAITEFSIKSTVK